MGTKTNMVRMALFAGVLAVCAWLALPLGPWTFTLQTFGVLLCLGTLGGKWGSGTIALYLLLGGLGLPVFSGFRGGLWMLVGPTGGFLWGFLLGGGCYWLLERWKVLAMACCMGAVYLCGWGWLWVYLPSGGAGAAFVTAVLPYLLPDAGKLALALYVSKRLNRIKASSAPVG